MPMSSDPSGIGAATMTVYGWGKPYTETEHAAFIAAYIATAIAHGKAPEDARLEAEREWNAYVAPPPRG